MSERQFSQIEKPAPRLCEVDHSEEFTSSMSGMVDDDQLRLSLKHMITTKHRINEKEYGGYEPNPGLYSELNLGWFQKVGLLKTIALRFKGSVKDVVDFTWPEGFSDQAIPPASKEKNSVEITPRRKEVPAIVEKISENLWERLSSLDQTNLTEAFFKDPQRVTSQVDEMVNYLTDFRSGKVQTPSSSEILGANQTESKTDLAVSRLKSLVTLSILEPQHPSVRTVVAWGRQLNDLVLLLGGNWQARESLYQAINSLDDVSRALLLSEISMTKRFEILKVGMDQVNEHEMAFFINMATYIYHRNGDPGDMEEILITTMERDESTESFSATKVVDAILRNYPNGANYIFRELTRASRQMDFGGHLMSFFYSHPQTANLAQQLERTYGDQIDEFVPWNRRL